MSPYREPPPAPKLPPRTPWYRLAWAFARGVFRRLGRRAEQQRALARAERQALSAYAAWLWRKEWARLRGWSLVDYQTSRGAARAIIRMAEALEREGPMRK